MCEFFSLVSDPTNFKIMYCNANDRAMFRSGELKIESPDSHSSIAKMFGYTGKQEDKLNKYEYNPLTKVFTVDQINNETDDSAEVEKFCNRLDFKTVVPELIVKPIVHPFRDVVPPVEITEGHLALLREWNSVWNSVSNSVWDSVSNSVWDSVGSSVRYSVWHSVLDSARYTVRDSVSDSVYAYVGSFLKLDKWEGVAHKVGAYPFQSAVDLWNLGLVPSFDGKVYRLHGGKEGKVLWEGKI